MMEQDRNISNFDAFSDAFDKVLGPMCVGETYSVSSSEVSSDSYLDRLNSLMLNFAKNPDDTPSRVAKCRAFWQYVDTIPELQKLMACGRKESDDVPVLSTGTLASEGVIPHLDSRRYHWFRQLQDMKSQKLDEAALATVSPQEPGCEQPKVIKESLDELNAEIELFETLNVKPERRDVKDAFQLFRQKPARSAKKPQDNN